MTLRGTGITSSRLGFGCAELYREPSRSKRRRLLEQALDAGIRHFDVAPMYGLGLGEPELGRFARSRRDQIVIATKFGIAPSSLARVIGRVQSPVRRLFNVSPSLRSRARSTASGPTSGPAGSLLYRAIGFDGPSARASLESSLRELQTDYLDLLLLHDPDPGRLRGDELCAYLEQARVAGQIRAWGIAGEPAPSFAVAQELAIAPGVLQVRDDIFEPTPAEPLGSAARITFGVLGRGIRNILAHLDSDPVRRRAWRDAVGVDCGDRQVLGGLLLRWAARSNPDGVVLFGTIRIDHIQAAVAAHARADGDLDAFVRQIGVHLSHPPDRRAED